MAHNNFIQVWAETGLFGFLAFCSVWLMFFRAMGCSRANNGLPVAGNQVHMDVSFRTLAAVAAFTGFAMIYGLFNSFEPLPESAPWLLTACFGLLWFGLYFANEQAQKPVFSEKTGFLELGITFGVLFFLIHSLVEFDLYEQGVAQTLWLLMAIAVASHPRTEKAIQFTLGSRGQMLVALPMVFLVAVLLCIVYPRFLEAKIRVENARDFVASKEEQKAVSEWVAAAQDDPWDSETQVALAEIFHAQWRSGIREYKGRSTLELSLSHIRRAIALNPRRSRYHHFLARLYQEMSGLEKNPGCAGEFRRAALGEFEQAYRLFPSRAPYAADLAFAYETAGRHAEALKLYETALDLDDAARPERFTTKLSPETRREIERRLQAPRK
jgi:tetratricopeptide (TPR) repeat protein